MKPLSQKEVANRLGVSVRTIYNWRKNGKVDALRVGNGSLRITRVHTQPADRQGTTSAT
jgi:excisionase family DNA binding protein